MNIFRKRSDLPFSHKSDRKKEKSVVSFTHEQNSNYLQPNIVGRHRACLLLAVIWRSCSWLSANEQSIFAMELEKLILKTSCQINISTKHISDVTLLRQQNWTFKTVWPIAIPFNALFTNMRILKFKSQLTTDWLTAVNHLNGPLRKQNFSLTGSKGHGLWFVIGRFRSVLCDSVFQGSLLVIVIIIDGSEKRNCEGEL